LKSIPIFVISYFAEYLCVISTVQNPVVNIAIQIVYVDKKLQVALIRNDVLDWVQIPNGKEHLGWGTVMQPFAKYL